MNYVFDGYNYTIKLNKDERLSEGMQAFFAAEPEVTGTIIAIGGVSRVTLGFYDLGKQRYQWSDIAGLREIASLSGTIAYDEDGSLMYHLHGVFGDAGYQTMAGHVKDFVVGGTCEIFVHRAYKPLRRKLDEAVGLKTLDL